MTAYKTKKGDLVEVSIAILAPSKTNARKQFDKKGLEDLKASLLSHGQLQNLVVVQTKGAIPGEDYHYEVIAGNRRLEALKQLQKEGKLPDPHHVWCQVVTQDEALEMSVAENIMREEMHPADEYQAFADMMTSGAKIPDIARRFGCDEKHVEKRMRLGDVHPELLKLFRDEKIDLKTLMAFTLTENKDEQLKAYKSLKSQGSVWSHTVKEKLTGKRPNTNDKRVQFVTLEAYEAAGGKVQKNLFADEQYIIDMPILQKLFDAKLKTEIDKLAKEGFKDICFTDDYYTEARSGTELSKAEAKKQAETCAVRLHFDWNGKLQVNFIGKAAKKAKKKEGGYSQSLVDDLKAYRMQIAQAEIAGNPDLALCLLIMRAFAGYNKTDDAIYLNYVRTGADITFTEHSGTQRVREDAETKANVTILNVQKSLPLAWLENDDEVIRFKELQKLDDRDKERLLAFAIARTLKESLQRDDEDDHYEEALSQLGNCVPLYWRPTRDNFLSRITSDDLLAIIEEIFGKATAKLYQAKPKKVLVAYLHEAFANPDKASVDMQIRLKLKEWLPKGMAFVAPPAKPAASKQKKNKKAA